MAKVGMITIAHGKWEATLKNLRATNKRVADLAARVKRLEQQVAKSR